jgi:hypothetical protein
MMTTMMTMMMMSMKSVWSFADKSLMTMTKSLPAVVSFLEVPLRLERPSEATQPKEPTRPEIGGAGAEWIASCFRSLHKVPATLRLLLLLLLQRHD